MKQHEITNQVVKQKQQENKNKKNTHKLDWWQLSLIGLGSVIGAGFFLGSGLAIQVAGPSILIGYLLAGITTYFVFGALAEMTIHDPGRGSFRLYAKKAFGPSMGFISGWVYWLSGVLIASSEVIALATFSQFWFPFVPLWLFSIVYAALGIGINLLGVKDFGKIESLFAVIKSATLITFIVFGTLILFGILSPKGIHISLPTNQPWFPNGFLGFWTGIIFVFFSFGGIAVLGIASTELKHKSDVSKAGTGTVVALVALYISSIFIVFTLVPWQQISEEESPFVTALSSFTIPYMDSIFNAIIISAAFSTLVGAIFSITSVLVSLSKDGDAPAFFSNKSSKGVATKALLFTAIAVSLSISLSYVLPDTVYEYFTTAAGVLLISNWGTILLSQIKLRPNYQGAKKFKVIGYPYTSYLSLGLILFAITGALFHPNQRMGLLLSLTLTTCIIIAYKWKKHLSTNLQ